MINPATGPPCSKPKLKFQKNCLKKVDKKDVGYIKGPQCNPLVYPTSLLPTQLGFSNAKRCSKRRFSCYTKVWSDA
jgi:hypothetical protein